MSATTDILLAILSQLASDFAIHIFVMLVAPYQSMKAIKERDHVSSTKWLTFWVVYATFEFFEKHIEFILELFPFYFTGKLLAVIFLMFFNGSELTFKYILDPTVTYIIKSTHMKLKEMAKDTSLKKSD